MPTRNVVITDRQAEMLDKLVKSGRYQNASEVLREGLRMVEVQEAEDQARLKVLRSAAREGIADFNAGRFVSFDSAKELHRHLVAVADETLRTRKPVR